MNTDRFLPKETDSWVWTPVKIRDIAGIIMLGEPQYRKEVEGLITVDFDTVMHRLHLAVHNQVYNNSEQLIVAKHKELGYTMAYAWLERGKFVAYSKEEIAEAKVLHVDLNLPTTTKIRLAAQAIQQWILWTQIHGIPVLVSNTVRQDQKGFLKLHEDFGFTIRGSYAFKRLK